MYDADGAEIAHASNSLMTQRSWRCRTVRCSACRNVILEWICAAHVLYQSPVTRSVV